MHGAEVLKGTIMVGYGPIRYCLSRTLTRNLRLLHPAMRFQYLWQAVQEAGHGGDGLAAPRFPATAWVAGSIAIFLEANPEMKRDGTEEEVPQYRNLRR